MTKSSAQQIADDGVAEKGKVPPEVSFVTLTPLAFSRTLIAMCLWVSAVLTASTYYPHLNHFDFPEWFHYTGYVTLAILFVLCSVGLMKDSPNAIQRLQLDPWSMLSILSNMLMTALEVAHKLSCRTPELGMRETWHPGATDFPWVIWSHSEFVDYLVWMGAVVVYIFMVCVFFGGVVNSVMQSVGNPSSSYVHIAVISFNDLCYIFVAVHEWWHLEGVAHAASSSWGGCRLIWQQTAWAANLVLAFGVLPADMGVLVKACVLKRRHVRHIHPSEQEP